MFKDNQTFRTRLLPTRVIEIVGMLLLTVSATGFATSSSTLEQFERDATRSHPQQQAEENDEEESDDGGSFLGDLFSGILEAIFKGIVSGIVDGGSDGQAHMDAAADVQDAAALNGESAGGDANLGVSEGSAGEREVQPEVELAMAQPNPGTVDDVNADEPYVYPVSAAPKKPIWKEGSGFAPKIRIDFSRNWITSRIDATDLRAEIGDEHLAFQIRNTRFEERDPDATLDVRHYHVLLRLYSGDDTIEIDPGIGVTDITGASSNYGLGWTLPVRIYPSPGFALEYRPVWTSINGNDVGDHELAASIEGQYWALRGGYRWLKSPNMSLDGPFMGASLRF